MSTTLTGLAIAGRSRTIPAKTPADYPALGVLVEEFDLWREGYDGATVTIYKAGTTDLMPCYTDIGLTIPVANPVTLLSKEDSIGRKFGKFNQSIYVPYAYELDVNTIEQTGIQRVPITTLDGQNASAAYVKSKTGSTNRLLSERFDDDIRALDYGQIGKAPSVDTATLAAAISAAAENGGGRVHLPPGTITITTLSVPSSVVLVGAGKGITIIQSQTAENVLTITGNGAGLENLTVDGVSLNEGSVGIYGLGRDNVCLTNIEVKRFDTGIKWQGGQNHVYRNLIVSNCAYGVRCLGDSNANGGGGGDEFSGLDWFQGKVQTTTNTGLEFSIIDDSVRHNTIHEVDFLDNVGASGAIYVEGADFTRIRGGYWDGNDINIDVRDSTDTQLTNRRVVGLELIGGQIDDGNCNFDGWCQDIILDRMELNATTLVMNVPENPILLRNCVEDGTLFTGQTTKVERSRTLHNGVIKGETTDATVTEAWSMKLNPNEVVYLDIKATAEQVNGSDFGVWHVGHAARQAPATLNYDGQSANFTVGSQIQGATSGATAIIASDSDSGSSGTLSLAQVSGTFENNEIISEIDGSGSARVNGVITLAATAEVGSETVHHSAGSNSGALPTGWDLNFAVNGQEIQVTVKGAAGKNLVWNLKIDRTVL